MGRKIADLITLEYDVPASYGTERIDRMDECGLSHTVPPQERDHLTMGYLYGYTLQNVALTNIGMDVPYLQHIPIPDRPQLL